MTVVNPIVPGDGDPRHGTANGYSNHGCRCDACRTATTEYHRARGTAGYAKDACACGNPKRTVATKCAACYDRDRDHAEHGTESKYRGGCRCDDCRSAQNAARARRRRTPNPAVHGSANSYANGCRCDECRHANTVKARERKAAKRAERIAA